jgi:hypothetical protein
MGIMALAAEEFNSILKRLSENDPELATLDLGFNDIGPDGAKAIAEALKNNNSLTTLDLMNNHIDDAGAQAIAEALKNNNSLTTLYLAFNEIGAETFREITTIIERNRNAFFDSTLKRLSENDPELTTLDLSNNQTFAESGKALAKALKDNNTLTTLKFGINTLGAETSCEIDTFIERNRNTLKEKALFAVKNAADPDELPRVLSNLKKSSAFFPDNVELKEATAFCEILQSVNELGLYGLRRYKTVHESIKTKENLKAISNAISNDKEEHPIRPYYDSIVKLKNEPSPAENTIIKAIQKLSSISASSPMHKYVNEAMTNLHRDLQAANIRNNLGFSSQRVTFLFDSLKIGRPAKPRDAERETPAPSI